ncbi:hypothetical protein [Endozoicomonas acroporae]|uniref:hypothetical protein n=1 Tax=Endozoicomonas acroporae TaxID=1701104 RepID=UPI003D7A6F64
MENTERQISYARKAGLDEICSEHERMLEQELLALEKALNKLAKAAFDTVATLPLLRDLYRQAHESQSQSLTEGRRACPYRLFTEVLDHLVPLAHVLVGPTIILATTKKFDRNIIAPAIKKSSLRAGDNGDGAELHLKSNSFHSVVSGNLSDQGVAALSYSAARKTFPEQIQVIKDDIYETDESNIFRKQRCAFDIILDEEHAAHNIFVDSTTDTLVDKDMNLAHALAAVNSIRAQVQTVSNDELGRTPYLESKTSFCGQIETVLRDSKIMPPEEFDQVLGLFTDNIDQIIVNSNSADRIVALTRDIFRIGRCTFVNDEALKRVRLRKACGDRVCEIYYGEEDIPGEVNLHQFYQALLCILCAGSRFDRKPRQFIAYLGGQSQGASRNSPLGLLIQHARETGRHSEGAFDGVMDTDQPIDLFFVHFCYKLVFSLMPEEKLRFPYDATESFINIRFHIRQIRESPEVALFRMLYNTRNRVFLLSATTGLKKHQADKYHRHFMYKYGQDPDANLGIAIRERRTTGNTVALRELRASYHQPEIHSIPEGADTIAHLPPEVANVFMDYWDSALLKSSEYLNIFQQRELSRQLSAMLLASYEQKHTFSLGISQRFVRAMQNHIAFLQTSHTTPSGGVRVLDKDRHVFEIRPFNDHRKLRVILFTASLGKKADELREWLTLDDADTTIAMLSYRAAAGTGVNFYPRYRHSLAGVDQPYEVDFDRLVLINGPFWSHVISHNGERTMTSIYNLMLLWREDSEGTHRRLGDYRDFHCLRPDQRQFLNSQHLISLLCEDNQSRGRNERKDCKILCELWIPEDVIRQNCLTYNYLNTDDNTPIFEQMSVNNWAYMEYCMQRRKGWLCKQGCREALEADSLAASTHLKTLVKDLIPDAIHEARKGDRQAALFRDALSSPRLLSNPAAAIKALKNLPYIRSSKAKQALIDSIYLSVEDYGPKDMVFCYSDQNHDVLTDMDGGVEQYSPASSLSIRDPLSNGVRVEQMVRLLLRKCHKLVTPDFSQHIPLPGIIPHLRGAVGECLFRQLLQMLNVSYLSVDEMFDFLGPQAYEQFDFYIPHDQSVSCIDVKNWCRGDKKEPSETLIGHLCTKLHAVTERLGNTPLTVGSVILLNTTLETNRDWLEAESFKVLTEYGEQMVQCMNLFEVFPAYHNYEKADKQGYLSGVNKLMTIKRPLLDQLNVILSSQTGER